MIPAVIYAVKSSPDEKDSVSTQVEVCHEAIGREGERELVDDAFTEQNESGSRANRGPQLEAAIRAAKEAASQHGEAELWVWQTSRLARGSGRKDEARALGKLLYDLRAAGVTVRSVEDDEFAKNEMLWGLASRLASKYAEDLKAWVKQGKERQRAAGQYLGGPAPDGYTQHHDVIRARPNGEPFRPRLIDPQRAPVIRRAFELGALMGDPSVAETLNREGHRRRSGKRWDRRRVQALLTNPHYAGLTHEGRALTQLDGSPVQALVSSEAFDAVATARAARDRAAAGRGRAQGGMPRGGRATTRFVLAKLGRCARCGGAMYARSSPYRRKDGSRARSYACVNSPAYDRSGATCDAPKIDAEAADAAIVPHLRSYFVDFDGWLGRFTDAKHADHAYIERHADASRKKLAKLRRAEQTAQDRYVDALAEDDTARIATLETALSRLTSERGQLEAALDDAEATLASLKSEAAPVDAMLDWWNALSTALRGALDEAGTAAEINARLREVLSEVQMETLAHGRIRLLAVFATRGEWVPKVDEKDEPLHDAEPDFFPDDVELLVPPGLKARPPIALPVETGGYSQA